jgi:hypothetical protein
MARARYSGSDPGRGDEGGSRWELGSRKDGAGQVSTSNHDLMRSPPVTSLLPSRTLGFIANFTAFPPNLEWVVRACVGWKERCCWGGGTIGDDRRSFAVVVRPKSAPIFMVPPGPMHGWGRSGFRAGRDGRGASHTNR